MFGFNWAGLSASDLVTNYGITPDVLTFEPHYSGTCEVADVPGSPYAVWREGDRYMVTQDNSVCKFAHDLSVYF